VADSRGIPPAAARGLLGTHTTVVIRPHSAPRRHGSQARYSQVTDRFSFDSGQNMYFKIDLYTNMLESSLSFTFILMTHYQLETLDRVE
jgi:hypothetical protein